MITYNSESNPNLFRIMDTAKRNYNIDFPLDYVIEHVGDCLRLIGKSAYINKQETHKVISNKIELPCYADSIYEIFPNLPFRFNGKTLTFTQVPDNTEVEVIYRVFQTDDNGFPLVDSEEEYYACLHWVIYQHFLTRFAMGIEKGDRLQFFENLKDRYIRQARISNTSMNKMEDYIKILKTTKSTRKRWK